MFTFIVGAIKAISEGEATVDVGIGWGAPPRAECVKALADAVAQSTSLQALGLLGIRFGYSALADEVVKALANAVAQSTSLQSLSLRYISVSVEGVKALADGMAQSKSLRRHSLEYRRIGVEGAKALADVLAQSKSLRTLYVQADSIGDEGAKALADGVAQSKSLQSLHLAEIRIGDEGAKALADGVAQSKSLQRLELWYLRIVDGDEGVMALAGGVAQSTTLQWLDLNSIGIGDEGATALANAVAQSKSLQWLDLRDNRIGDEGAKALTEGVVQSKSLQTLGLGYNRIGDEGAKALADAVAQSKSLQTLYLWGNSIGDEGAKALADAVAQSKLLQTLYLCMLTRDITRARMSSLGRKSIGDEGAKALAAAVAQSKSLRTLDLGYNSIGDEGAKSLADALAQSKSLQTLNLGYNKIGNKGAKALAAALEHNKSVLLCLNLHNNRFGNAGAAALADALETNDTLQELSLPYGISEDIEKRIGGRLKLAKREVNALSASALEALEFDEKARWGRAKLMVVGKGAAGKTSTIRTLLGQPVVFEYDSTIGVDLKLMHTRDWEECLHTGDADLGEQFAKHKYRRRPSTANRLSQGLSRARRSVSRASQPREASPRPPSSQFDEEEVSGAGTTPLRVREASPRPPSMRFDEKEVSRAVKTPLRVRVKEQGGKVDEEVSFTIWDYGGEKVFYALHHLFLTQYGVYALVFDMREVLGKERFEDVLDAEELDRLGSQEEALETLRFWIDSIRLHAPGVAVALIGTYSDQVPDAAQHEEIQDILKASLLKGLGGEVEIQRNRQGGGVLQFFPIDNVGRDDTEERPANLGNALLALTRCFTIKKTVYQRVDRDDAAGRAANLRNVLTKSVIGRPFVKEEVPLRWSYCLNLLLKAEAPYMTLGEVGALAQEKCYVADVDKMLEYMHELGVLVHLTSNETLRKVVVLRPQWLLDNLSRVICDPGTKHMQKHKENLMRVEGRKELPHDLEDALDEWADRGVASRALLEWLWQDEPVDYLTSLMEAMLLASPSPWNRSADEDGEEGVDAEGALLVPSLLRAATDADRQEALDRMGPDALAYAEFKFLPEGFFQRFVAMVVKSFARLATVRRRMFSDLASIDFDGVECVMEASAKRVVFTFGGRQHWGQLPDLLKLLHRSLDEIDRSFMRGRLAPKLYVSADGSDNDAACVLLKALASPDDNGRVRSRNKKARLPLEAFAAFVQDAAQAHELQESMASTGTPSYDVFLSHACGPGERTHAKVVAVAEGLPKLGISCWLDAKDMGTSIFRSMAEGIDDSKATVIFVTKDYMDKVNKGQTKQDNCRSEFHYAMNRRKLARVIPCVLDPTMTDTSAWEGEFGIRWDGNPLYVPMLSDDGPTAEELEELAQRIREAIVD